MQLSALLGFLLASTSFALSGESSCAGIEREHSAWGSLLGRYVHDGLVDYESWKRQGITELNNYFASLSSLCAAAERAAGRDQPLAFWINAYNAFTVKLILDHYPVASIRSIGWLPHAAFKMKFIPINLAWGKGTCPSTRLRTTSFAKSFGSHGIQEVAVVSECGRFE